MTKKDLLNILNDKLLSSNQNCQNIKEKINCLLYSYSDDENIELEILNNLTLEELVESRLNTESTEIKLSKIFDALKIWVECKRKEEIMFSGINTKKSKTTTAFVVIIIVLSIVTAVFMCWDVFGNFKYGNELSMVFDGIGLISGLAFFAYERITDKNKKDFQKGSKQQLENDLKTLTLSFHDDHTENHYDNHTENHYVVIDPSLFAKKSCETFQENGKLDNVAQTTMDILKDSAKNQDGQDDCYEPFVFDSNMIKQLAQSMEMQTIKNEELRPLSIAIDGLNMLCEAEKINSATQSSFILFRSTLYKNALRNQFIDIQLNKQDIFTDVSEYRDKLLEVSNLTKNDLENLEKKVLQSLKIDFNKIRDNADKILSSTLNNDKYKDKSLNYRKALQNQFSAILLNKQDVFINIDKYRAEFKEMSNTDKNNLEHKLLNALKPYDHKSNEADKILQNFCSQFKLIGECEIKCV